jgi:glycosyltransferase involved in cell wall biosynthesis
LKTKKIIVVAPAYAPSLGGVEKHLLSVNRELIKLDIQPAVLVRYSADQPAKRTIEGVRVYRLPKRLSSPAGLLWLARHLHLFRGITAIHTHDVYIPAFHRLASHAKQVHTFHGYEGYPVTEEAKRSRQFVRKHVPFCYGVGAFIEKWYGTPCDKVIYGATDIAPALHTKPEWDALFIGRLETDTGFRTYLEAFKLIHAKHPAARLLVLGDGTLRKWAEAYTSEHKLPVTFRGNVADVVQYLQVAEVAFVSGYLAILEAGICKVPIVAFYDTPIKKDYLECHPQAQNFLTASSPEQIAQGYIKAKAAKDASLAELQSWAHQQTWEKLARDYASRY